VIKDGPIGAKNFMIAAAFFMLREIEASSAMARHIEFSDDKVSWWLPASKTDVEAKSVRLTWGCVCRSSSSKAEAGPCPLHALESQYAILEKYFGEKSGWPDSLPLFPTINGQQPSKHAMVKTIERIAGRAGDRLIDERGRPTMGGHSSRITGARHLARTGVEVYIIQLLARHSSAIILHYVSDIPLEQITDHYSRERTSKDLNMVLNKSESYKKEMKETMTRLKLDVSEVIENELTLRSRVNDIELQDKGMSIVVNLDSMVAHVPHRYHKTEPPGNWATKCGWKFGGKRFSWTDDTPTTKQTTCDRCFPDLNQSNQESSSSSSSGSSSDEDK
jgi:hypothetical protein